MNPSMKEETSIVQKPERLFEDMVLPENTEELARFMEEPPTAIAEAITGALALGPKGWAVMGGRIVQGILKAKLFQQVSKEIKELREKGKISDDYADEQKHKYGFKSWVEPLTIIDEDSPDADRLEALKAMFYCINKVNTSDGERIVSYQLFQIAKKLTSGQLLYLNACHRLYQKRNFSTSLQLPTSQWLQKVGKELGHEVLGLLDQDDAALVDYGLLTPRLWQDKSGVNENNARLTGLGIRFCLNVETYRIETQ